MAHLDGIVAELLGNSPALLAFISGYQVIHPVSSAIG